MNKLIKLTIVLGCLLVGDIHAEINSEPAEEKVENSACKADTVRIALKQKIKKHSQRDLGWRIFSEDNYIDVERVVLVNKGKRIRYRWRIDDQGNVFPVSKKAKKLCLP